MANKISYLQQSTHNSHDLTNRILKLEHVQRDVLQKFNEELVTVNKDIEILDRNIVKVQNSSSHSDISSEILKQIQTRFESALRQQAMDMAQDMSKIEQKVEEISIYLFH